MNKDYMKNWTEMSSKMQKPMKDLMELNAKTFQQLKFMKMEDLSDIKHPEELLSKNINLMVENGHKVLSCMEESFHILEEAFLAMSKEIKQTTEQGLKEAKGDMFKNQMFSKEDLFKPVTPKVQTELKTAGSYDLKDSSAKGEVKMKSSSKSPLKTEAKFSSTAKKPTVGKSTKKKK